MQQEIDFVVTWVDGSDPAWQQEKNRYLLQKQEDGNTERYRDWGLLKYWFRGVEKFAPWVRKVHFVTWGHLPDFLKEDAPKLHIVKHTDFIPAEYLPTFNSNAIEMHLHRIKGLSEQFVYFNDDIFPIRPLKKTDFFRDGKPCDMLAFQPVIANPENPVMSHIYLNNTLVLSKYFTKRENVKMQPPKYFKLGYPPKYFIYNLLELAFPQLTGFYTVHSASPFLRQSFLELWEKEGEVLRATSMHRFRSEEDVNPYLMREWQKLSGNFAARNVAKDSVYYDIGNDNRRLCDAIRGQRTKLCCINDVDPAVSYERARQQVAEAFEGILPEKSGFEK